MIIACWRDTRKGLSAAAAKTVRDIWQELVRLANEWVRDGSIPGLDAISIVPGKLNRTPHLLLHPEGRPWHWQELDQVRFRQQDGCSDITLANDARGSVFIVGAPLTEDWLSRIAAAEHPLVIVACAVPRDDPLRHLPDVTVCRHTSLAKRWRAWLGNIVRDHEAKQERSSASAASPPAHTPHLHQDPQTPLPSLVHIIAQAGATGTVQLPAGAFEGEARITTPLRLIGDANGISRICAAKGSVLTIAAPVRLEHLVIEHASTSGVAITVTDGGSLETHHVTVRGAIIGITEEEGWQLPQALTLSPTQPGTAITIDLYFRAPCPSSWSTSCSSIRVAASRLQAGEHCMRIWILPGSNRTITAGEVYVDSPRFRRVIHCSVEWSTEGTQEHHFLWRAGEWRSRSADAPPIRDDEGAEADAGASLPPPHGCQPHDAAPPAPPPPAAASTSGAEVTQHLDAWGARLQHYQHEALCKLHECTLALASIHTRLKRMEDQHQQWAAEQRSQDDALRARELHTTDALHAVVKHLNELNAVFQQRVLHLEHLLQQHHRFQWRCVLWCTAINTTVVIICTIAIHMMIGKR